MGIQDLPKKWRELAHGDSSLLMCADELEAHLKRTAVCYVAAAKEIHFEIIVPDAIFTATLSRATSCTLSTNSGDTRRGVLVFD